MGSRSYKDLVVWQKSIALCKLVYLTCASFPRRVVRPGESNETGGGFSCVKYRGRKSRPHLGEFRQFLAMAYGSLAELDTQRIIGEDLGLIDPSRSSELDNAITDIRKMLYALNAQAQAAR